MSKMDKQQRVKYFDSRVYSADCELVLKKSNEAQRYLNALNAFEPLKNLKEIQEYLQKKEGWSNHSLTASTLGKEDEYNIILSHEGKVNPKDYNSDFSDLSEYCQNRLIKKHTTYWTEAEAKVIEEGERVVRILNDLPTNVRAAIYHDRHFQYAFNELYWSNYGKY
tara:strand:- start:1699 stop:2196 length:498 start_codon:yes stop_codon:yes gene_type:complete